MSYDIPEIGKVHMAMEHFDDPISMEVISEECFENAQVCARALRTIGIGMDLLDWSQKWKNNLKYLHFARGRCEELGAWESTQKITTMLAQLVGIRAEAVRTYWNLWKLEL